MANKEVAFEIKRANALKEMLRTEGWQYYLELMDAEFTSRSTMMLEPMRDGETLKAEHNKGAMYMIAWLRNLPQVTVDATQDLKSSTTSGDEDAAEVE